MLPVSPVRTFTDTFAGVPMPVSTRTFRPLPFLLSLLLSGLTLAAGCALQAPASADLPADRPAASGASTAVAADAQNGTDHAGARDAVRETAPDAAGRPPLFERTLPNGMQVIVREDHRAPTAVHLVLYQVGGVDEPGGRTGISHMLEHMMFKGTTAHPAGEFSRIVAALGGRENAFTSGDYTGYFQQIDAQHLAEVMRLEADRMNGLLLTSGEFEPELRVVMEERRMRTEDQPRALVYEQFRAQAFLASAVRQPVVGWFSDLQALTVDKVRAWYQDWYTPSNAVVIVVGDVRADEVWALAQQTYGRVPAHAVPARNPLDEPAQRGPRRSEVKAPAKNPYVIMGFRVPRLENPETDREPYALEVLAAVLDADENGRLTRNVVRATRVANQVGAGYGLVARGPGLFVLDGTPAEGHTTADVEQALRAELTRIAQQPVAAEELERIKTQYVAGKIYERDSIMAQAMQIGALRMRGFSPADADRILERIQAVTADEVQAVAHKYFSSDDALTVTTLVPQASAGPDGAQDAGHQTGNGAGIR